MDSARCLILAWSLSGLLMMVNCHQINISDVSVNPLPGTPFVPGDSRTFQAVIKFDSDYTFTGITISVHGPRDFPNSPYRFLRLCGVDIVVGSSLTDSGTPVDPATFTPKLLIPGGSTNYLIADGIKYTGSGNYYAIGGTVITVDFLLIHYGDFTKDYNYDRNINVEVDFTGSDPQTISTDLNLTFGNYTAINATTATMYTGPYIYPNETVPAGSTVLVRTELNFNWISAEIMVMLYLQYGCNKANYRMWILNMTLDSADPAYSCFLPASSYHFPTVNDVPDCSPGYSSASIDLGGLVYQKGNKYNNSEEKIIILAYVYVDWVNPSYAPPPLTVPIIAQIYKYQTPGYGAFGWIPVVTAPTTTTVTSTTSTSTSTELTSTSTATSTTTTAEPTTSSTSTTTPEPTTTTSTTTTPVETTSSSTSTTTAPPTTTTMTTSSSTSTSTSTSTEPETTSTSSTSTSTFPSTSTSTSTSETTTSSTTPPTSTTTSTAASTSTTSTSTDGITTTSSTSTPVTSTSSESTAPVTTTTSMSTAPVTSTTSSSTSTVTPTVSSTISTAVSSTATLPTTLVPTSTNPATSTAQSSTTTPMVTSTSTSAHSSSVSTTPLETTAPPTSTTISTTPPLTTGTTETPPTHQPHTDDESTSTTHPPTSAEITSSASITSTSPAITSHPSTTSSSTTTSTSSAASTSSSASPSPLPSSTFTSSAPETSTSSAHGPSSTIQIPSPSTTVLPPMETSTPELPLTTEEDLQTGLPPIVGYPPYAIDTTEASATTDDARTSMKVKKTAGTIAALPTVDTFTESTSTVASSQTFAMHSSTVTVSRVPSTTWESEEGTSSIGVATSSSSQSFDASTDDSLTSGSARTRKGRPPIATPDYLDENYGGGNGAAGPGSRASTEQNEDRTTSEAPNPSISISPELTVATEDGPTADTQFPTDIPTVPDTTSGFSWPFWGFTWPDFTFPSFSYPTIAPDLTTVEPTDAISDTPTSNDQGSTETKETTKPTGKVQQAPKSTASVDPQRTETIPPLESETTAEIVETDEPIGMGDPAGTTSQQDQKSSASTVSSTGTTSTTSSGTHAWGSSSSHEATSSSDLITNSAVTDRTASTDRLIQSTEVSSTNEAISMTMGKSSWTAASVSSASVSSPTSEQDLIQTEPSTIASVGSSSTNNAPGVTVDDVITLLGQSSSRLATQSSAGSQGQGSETTGSVTAGSSGFVSSIGDAVTGSTDATITISAVSGMASSSTGVRSDSTADARTEATITAIGSKSTALTSGHPDPEVTGDVNAPTVDPATILVGLESSRQSSSSISPGTHSDSPAGQSSSSGFSTTGLLGLTGSTARIDPSSAVSYSVTPDVPVGPTASSARPSDGSIPTGQSQPESSIPIDHGMTPRLTEAPTIDDSEFFGEGTANPKTKSPMSNSQSTGKTVAITSGPVGITSSPGDQPSAASTSSPNVAPNAPEGTARTAGTSSGQPLTTGSSQQPQSKKAPRTAGDIPGYTGAADMGTSSIPTEAVSNNEDSGDQMGPGRKPTRSSSTATVSQAIGNPIGQTLGTVSSVGSERPQNNGQTAPQGASSASTPYTQPSLPMDGNDWQPAARSRSTKVPRTPGAIQPLGSVDSQTTEADGPVPTLASLVDLGVTPGSGSHTNDSSSKSTNGTTSTKRITTSGTSDEAEATNTRRITPKFGDDDIGGTVSRRITLKSTIFDEDASATVTRRMTPKAGTYDDDGATVTRRMTPKQELIDEAGATGSKRATARTDVTERESGMTSRVMNKPSEDDFGATATRRRATTQETRSSSSPAVSTTTTPPEKRIQMDLKISMPAEVDPRRVYFANDTIDTTVTLSNPSDSPTAQPAELVMFIPPHLTLVGITGVNTSLTPNPGDPTVIPAGSMGPTRIRLPQLKPGEVANLDLRFQVTPSANLSRARPPDDPFRTAIIMQPISYTNNPSDPKQPNKVAGKLTHISMTTALSSCQPTPQIFTVPACRLLASSTAAGTNVSNIRLDGTGYWTSEMRPDEKHWIAVAFPRTVQVQTLVISSDSSKFRRPTTVRLEYSSEGERWFEMETLDLVYDPTGISKTQISNALPTSYYRLVIEKSDNPQMQYQTPVGMKMELLGCSAAISTDDGSSTCVLSPPTVPKDRQFIASPTGGVFYCAYDEEKARKQCYGSKDGDTWNALSSQIGSIASISKTGRIYASSQSGLQYAASDDNGATWTPITSSEYETGVRSPGSSAAVAIPYLAKGDPAYAKLTAGDWTASFDGLYHAGVRRFGWTSCCSG